MVFPFVMKLVGVPVVAISRFVGAVRFLRNDMG